MRNVFFATDHAGFQLKEELVPFVQALGYSVEDLGAHELNVLDDYPDMIRPCALRVAEDPGAFGIILGGSGQGEAMVANRIQGIRAAVFYGGSLELVTLAREHNDANILSLGARFLSVEDAKEAVSLFLSTSFSEDARHLQRIKKF